MTELTFESTSRFVQIPQGRLHYNEAGDPDAHPLIMIHGSGAGATGWTNFRGNIPALAEHFRVLAIDVIGWGLSDAKSPEEWDQAGMVREFVDELGIEKAALVGNSMGGAITLAFTARNQERVSHMITMGPGFSSEVPLQNTPAGPSEGLKVLQEGYRNPTPETMKKLTQIMAFDQRFATDELAALRSESALANPQHLKNFVHGLDNNLNRRGNATVAEIRSIKVPSLLIHGRDDRVVSFENTLRLVACLDNSAAVIINQCGHWAQIEHEEYFNRLVIDFVTNGYAGAGGGAKDAIGG